MRANSASTALDIASPAFFIYLFIYLFIYYYYFFYFFFAAGAGQDGGDGRSMLEPETEQLTHGGSPFLSRIFKMASDADPVWVIAALL